MRGREGSFQDSQAGIPEQHGQRVKLAKFRVIPFPQARPPPITGSGGAGNEPGNVTPAPNGGWVLWALISGSFPVFRPCVALGLPTVFPAGLSKPNTLIPRHLKACVLPSFPRSSTKREDEARLSQKPSSREEPRSPAVTVKRGCDTGGKGQLRKGTQNVKSPLPGGSQESRQTSVCSSDEGGPVPSASSSKSHYSA